MKRILISSAATLAFAGASTGVSYAQAMDVCNTPTALGDLGNFAGETITIAGPFEGREEEVVNNIFACFEQATGATVEYSGSGEFESLIVADIRSGNAPNIAIFPQPGLAADMASEDGLVPLGDDMAAWTSENYGAGDSWVALGTYANSAGRSDLCLPLQGGCEISGLVFS